MMEKLERLSMQWPSYMSVISVLKSPLTHAFRCTQSQGIGPAPHLGKARLTKYGAPQPRAFCKAPRPYSLFKKIAIIKGFSSLLTKRIKFTNQAQMQNLLCLGSFSFPYFHFNCLFFLMQYFHYTHKKKKQSMRLAPRLQRAIALWAFRNTVRDQSQITN